jgi:adenine-specific DNA-methyltransferase
MPLLHWLTRDADLKLSSKAPYRLLEHVPELSFGDADSENMLIQGDNLDALKTPAAVLCGPGEVHLYRPALQHRQ